MRNLRRHLGPGYTEYPAKRIAEFLGDKLFKVVMWIVCCVLWAGVYYIALAVVNMNRTNFMENAKKMTNTELFFTPGGLSVYGAGCLILLYIVHKSRRGEKRIRQQQYNPKDALLKRPKK
jgi:glucan phosphoethanolaminetransferase (alkaline phosphatase superfamily)